MATLSPPVTTAGDRSAAVRFTETMSGPFALGVSDPVAAAAGARPMHEALSFRLTISTGSVSEFLADPRHEGTSEGFVECDLLGGRLPVERGWFNLLVRTGVIPGVEPFEPDGRRMLYRLWFRDPGGTPLTLVGYKKVRNDSGLDMWSDTTTLYTQVLGEHIPIGDGTPEDQVRGAGILRMTPLAFARQLTTFRADGSHPSKALIAFGSMFISELWDVFGRPLPPRGPGRRAS